MLLDEKREGDENEVADDEREGREHGAPSNEVGVSERDDQRRHGAQHDGARAVHER